MYLQDLPAAARAIRQGLTTSRALVEAALERYAQREPAVHAFAWLDKGRALRLADQADAAVREHAEIGLLHGIPIGVKDIFDTAGVPTENGSALFAGRIPRTSAAAVEALEAAGAIVIGKTVTTEMAFLHPGPTRNPHDPGRTPGGSSMGSAAAVAAGMIPGAIGSQTNGSVIRPATFCGVVGMKPTYRRLPIAGAMPFAPTLDHVGTFTRTVEGAAWMCAAISRAMLEDWWGGEPTSPLRLAAVRTKDWESASEPMRARFQLAIDALATAGRPIEWPALPSGLDDAVPVLRTIMARESVATIGASIARDPSKASQLARDIVAEGDRSPEETYRAALRERERLIREVTKWASHYDAVLALAAKDEAPTSETTGDPIFCTRWTLTGAPAVTIPIGRGPSGLPLGLQLVGAPGDDRRVLGAAAWAERILSGW